MNGEGDCWLCDTKIKELNDSGDPGKQKRAAGLEAKEQFVVQVATIDPDTQKWAGRIFCGQ